mmetsp:Transcript_182/g.618  ORF Transcript_182/g.618 Transcript_182/m.618 type:complete len:250 (-) Transcript_182:251-1000(-)
MTRSRCSSESTRPCIERSGWHSISPRAATTLLSACSTSTRAPASLQRRLSITPGLSAIGDRSHRCLRQTSSLQRSTGATLAQCHRPCHRLMYRTEPRNGLAPRQTRTQHRSLARKPGASVSRKTRRQDLRNPTMVARLLHLQKSPDLLHQLSPLGCSLRLATDRPVMARMACTTVPLVRQTQLPLTSPSPNSMPWRTTMWQTRWRRQSPRRIQARQTTRASLRWTTNALQLLRPVTTSTARRRTAMAIP